MAGRRGSAVDVLRGTVRRVALVAPVRDRPYRQGLASDLQSPPSAVLFSEATTCRRDMPRGEGVRVTAGLALLALAACSGPAPQPVTWTLWRIDSVYRDGARTPFRSSATAVERDLDRVSCELVQGKRADGER